MGKLINEAKTAVTAEFDQVLERIEAAELAAKLGPAFRPLPAWLQKDDPPDRPGAGGNGPPIPAYPVSRLPRQPKWRPSTTASALNIPGDHLAGTVQVPYYLPDQLAVSNVGNTLMRNICCAPCPSTVQIRTMLKEKPFVRIVAPGRCFCARYPRCHPWRELFDRRSLCGPGCQPARPQGDPRRLRQDRVQARENPGTRLRPSFFPFTEPSFEMDFFSARPRQAQQRAARDYGLVDPEEVFRAVGIDPEVYTNYAFGMGIERIAMILQGVVIFATITRTTCAS